MSKTEYWQECSVKGTVSECIVWVQNYFVFNEIKDEDELWTDKHRGHHSCYTHCSCVYLFALMQIPVGSGWGIWQPTTTPGRIEFLEANKVRFLQLDLDWGNYFETLSLVRNRSHYEILYQKSLHYWASLKS